MTGTHWLLLLIPLAYLSGSVPFGLLVGLARGVDPRKAGSGNIGATNVGRLLGGRFFALVFTLDLLKSLLPMLAATAIVRQAGETWAMQCLWLGVGFAAILGHMFSCFLSFTGGKGVATSAGVLLGLWPYLTLPGLLGIITWLIVFLPWRYVSLASIIGAVALPIYFIVLGLLLGWGPFSEHMPLLLFVILVAALVVVRHRSNIARLRAGTEHRFSSKRS